MELRSPLPFIPSPGIWQGGFHALYKPPTGGGSELLLILPSVFSKLNVLAEDIPESYSKHGPLQHCTASLMFNIALHHCSVPELLLPELARTLETERVRGDRGV